MRRAAFVVLLAMAAPIARAEDPVSIELTATHDTCFVEQLVTVQLTITIDDRFFATKAIQLFHKELDVPVQVDRQWLEELPATVAVEGERRRDGSGPGPGPGPGARASIAVGDSVLEAGYVPPASDWPAGRTGLLIERTLVPTRPGDLAIPAPLVRYAYATSFREDFVLGRVPVDRHDAVSRGAPLTLTVRPLPEDGRPEGFAGAVGRFAVTASTDRTDVGAGEIIQLTLTVAGRGNTGRFEPPRLAGLEDVFHVQGRVDDASAGTFAYAIAPLRADVTEVPPIPFSFFDPAEAAYRTVSTDAIPITVRPRAEAGPDPAPEDTVGAPVLEEEPSAGPAGVLIAIAVVAVIAVALLLLLIARRRGQGERDPYDHATDVWLRNRSKMSGPELAGAFTDYLGVMLRCPSATVVSPELRDRLDAAGVPADLANRTATLVERLVTLRYGSAAPESAEIAEINAEVHAVAAELEGARRDRSRT